MAEVAAAAKRERVFPNLDGVRFLPHQGGCGGTRQDSQALCGLLAGYIHHPNVAGATVLSLGCQHAQASILMEELRARDPQLRKPVVIVDQQSAGQESALMEQALDKTFAALAEANRAERAPAPLSALTVGLQCGGSDGFSGISANPTVGYVSDLVVGAGGTTMLSEFPELHGVEQELINRCTTDELAAALPRPDADLCGERPGREFGLRFQSLARQHPRRPHHRRHQVRRRGAQGRRRRPSAACSIIPSTSARADSTCNARRATTWRA